MGTPRLPVAKSFEIEPEPKKRVRHRSQGCMYCGERGHNRTTCKDVASIPQRLADTLKLMKADKNPMEWERLVVMKDALRFLTTVATDPRASKETMRKALKQVRQVAFIGLEASRKW